MPQKILKIILTGGGTGGSVMPLIAMAEKLKANKQSEYGYDFLWIGTLRGPEKSIVEEENIKFSAITGGKWRRYFSLRNFADLFKILAGFWQAFFILLKYRPNLIISAGSFISVPVIWAGWLLRVPSLIHQQDALPGLANRLMAPFVKAITVTFERSVEDYGPKAVWTGNIIRSRSDDKISPSESKRILGLGDDKPAVLVIGGGTGAVFINNLITDGAEELADFCQVILITGQNKDLSSKMPDQGFKIFPYLNRAGILAAYAAADLVVSRCGMSTLTELAYFNKPAILIPIPDSHQEANAKIFEEAKAAVVLNQNEISKETFVSQLRELLSDKAKQAELAFEIKKVIKTDGENAIIKIIEELMA